MIRWLCSNNFVGITNWQSCVLFAAAIIIVVALACQAVQGFNDWWDDNDDNFAI